MAFSLSIYSAEPPLAEIKLMTESKIEAEEKQYLTNTKITEDYLERLLGHKTLYPQVLNSQGIPSELHQEILSYIIPYTCLQRK